MPSNITGLRTQEISIEQIILHIKATRDQQIDELRKEPILINFLEQHFNTNTISAVKKAFLLRDLAELKNSPLDLSHYSSLITHMKEVKTLEVNASHNLLLTELGTIFRKYVSNS